MANLGMANGAVFQLVPQRFGKDIGIMTNCWMCWRTWWNCNHQNGISNFGLVKKGTFEGYTAGFLIFVLLYLWQSWVFHL